MTPMKQAVNDWLIAQGKVMQLALLSRQNLHSKFAPWSQQTHEDWARAVRTQQRECRRCGTTLPVVQPSHHAMMMSPASVVTVLLVGVHAPALHAWLSRSHETTDSDSGAAGATGRASCPASNGGRRGGPFEGAMPMPAARPFAATLSAPSVTLAVPVMPAAP